jgi:hypothetical protein
MDQRPNGGQVYLCPMHSNVRQSNPGNVRGAAWIWCPKVRDSPYNICYVPKGTGETDWHNPPQRLLVLWLTGEVEFETSDGNIRRLPAGSVVLAEDTTGKGHITRHPRGGQLVVHVALA